jgi:hypothetical protein
MVATPSRRSTITGASLQPLAGVRFRLQRLAGVSVSIGFGRDGGDSFGGRINASPTTASGRFVACGQKGKTMATSLVIAATRGGALT